MIPVIIGRKKSRNESACDYYVYSEQFSPDVNRFQDVCFCVWKEGIAGGCGSGGACGWW